MLIEKARIQSTVDNSTTVATAWVNHRMVGFARFMADFVFNDQINNVVVDEEYIRLWYWEKTGKNNIN